MGSPCPRCVTSHRARSGPPGARCAAKALPFGCSRKRSRSAAEEMGPAGRLAARVASCWRFNSALAASSRNAVFGDPSRRTVAVSSGRPRRSRCSSCFASVVPRACVPASAPSPPPAPPPKPPRCAEPWNPPRRLAVPAACGLPTSASKPVALRRGSSAASWARAMRCSSALRSSISLRNPAMCDAPPALAAMEFIFLRIEPTTWAPSSSSSRPLPCRRASTESICARWARSCPALGSVSVR